MDSAVCTEPVYSTVPVDQPYEHSTVQYLAIFLVESAVFDNQLMFSAVQGSVARTPHTVLCWAGRAAGCRAAPAPELLRRQANHTNREQRALTRCGLQKLLLALWPVPETAVARSLI